MARLTSFLDPQASTNDIGYQVLQSQSAIGSGGIFGKDLDAATLANLGSLPEEQTDFIFANVAEKLGFVGGVVLLGLFFVLIWRILRVASTARDRFGVLVAVGIGTVFLFHVVVNVGMTMGIMPVTGIPLPFISYGRSNLMVSLSRSASSRASPPAPARRRVVRVLCRQDWSYPGWPVILMRRRVLHSFGRDVCSQF